MAMLWSAFASLFVLQIVVALATGQDATTAGSGSLTSLTSNALPTSVAAATIRAQIEDMMSETVGQLTSSSTMLPSTQPSSSASPTSTSSSSSAPSSSTSTSSSMSPSTSTSTSASTRSSSQAPTSTSGKFVPVYPDQSVAEYSRIVAAVCAGCGLLLLTLVFMVVVSLLLRYTVRTERRKSPKPGKAVAGGNAGFYSAGAGQQSHQALFSNLSGTNIVGGYSDLHLDAKDARGVYMNRGYDSSTELHNAGASISTGTNGGGSGGYDGPYRPIEIKSSQDQRQTKA